MGGNRLSDKINLSTACDILEMRKSERADQTEEDYFSDQYGVETDDISEMFTAIVKGYAEDNHTEGAFRGLDWDSVEAAFFCAFEVGYTLNQIKMDGCDQ